jgi:hypothetical protein
MKKGESVRGIPSIDGTTTGEKATSEAKNKPYDNDEVLQPFKEIPWQQGVGKSGNHQALLPKPMV